ncbi:protein mono-ADP-ribosyltransferase PARP14-like isoform X1 [Leucoraja erinacea]|uniref:protein mono-ADP-ribosyltransferase PARP14-like isoform X1 n=1 Tax=Leucoraja erinaceus TaxID=7782 RepID=UPI0024574300|nr:protein mono-ADP-ribosyltransferase PARP14-like isoform X1 [Leucoraja erinacea]XP_055494688.1 protein mono-ADP-ribosyltransferase PARP14-like isoform X1 [Leucoraja erinacea]
MAGFPVLVEGLNVDLDTAKNKLAIYFQSKRNSGGGECEIKPHPDRAKFLVYFESEKVQRNVANRKCHTVQLSTRNPVQLQVTIYKEDNGNESSERFIGVTPGTDNVLDVEQSQLLTSPNKLSGHCQSLLKQVQIQKSPSQHQESASELFSNQLLVRSNSHVDRDVIEMFFERFSPDVEISVKSERSWILTCHRRNDLEKIISQEQYTIAGNALNVQLYDKRKEDEKFESRQFILKGFDDSSRLQHISLYIDSLSNNAMHNIEPLQDGTSVVVTFTSDIDSNSFVWNCCQKPFENNNITAQRLRKTDSVLIEGLHPNINEDLLDLYFSNNIRSGGGEIAEIHIKAFEGVAVLRFHDPEVTKNVVEKKHSLRDSQLTVCRYYPDLQLSLYGANGPKVKLHEECSICVNPLLLSFIQTNMHYYNRELEQVSKDVYCNISFADSTNSEKISLKPSLDANTLLWYKIANNWKKHATVAIQKFMERFDFKDFQVDQDLWENVKCRSNQFKLPGLVNVVHLPTENKVVIVGESSNVLDASTKLQGILKKAKEELENERNTVVVKIPFESYEELEFLQTNVQDDISFVEVSTNIAPPFIKLKGLKEKVGKAHEIISNLLTHLERKSLNQSSHMKDFIKSLDLKKFVQTHFVKSGLKATLLKRKSLELLAIKADVMDAEDKMKQLFHEETINITPEQIHVTQDGQWTKFLHDLKTQQNSTCTFVEEKNPASVIIVGFSNNVSDAAKILRSVLNEEQITMMFISTENILVDYMENFSFLHELPEVQSQGVTISFVRTPKSGLQVFGRAKQMKNAVSAIKDSLSLVCKQTLTYCNAGETNALTKHIGTLQDKAKIHDCLLLIKIKEELRSKADLLKHVAKPNGEDHELPANLLIDPRSDGNIVATSDGQQRYGVSIYLPSLRHPDADGQSVKEDHQLKIQNAIVKVKKGDITMEVVDAIVNSTNNTMDFNSGVSKAILEKAGQFVRDQCFDWGILADEDVVVTGSGLLFCNNIIHVVGQRDPALITTLVENVLEECENQGFSTISFPALGTGAGNVNPEDSAESMLNGFENHLIRNPTSVIRLIHVVTLDPNVHKAFKDALKQNSQLEMQETGINIGTVMVLAVPGDITKETTDAIVNSTNSHLSLGTGVSKAILTAGGQPLVDECNKLGVQNEDSVITTGAGNLSVKYVIHWIKWAQTNDIKASIGRILIECERLQISSVSLPAIGTGAGKLNPVDIANALLDAISDHVKNCVRPTTLSLIRIILFTPETRNLFCQCMEQRFKTWKCDVPTTSSLNHRHQIAPFKSAYPIILNTKKLLTSTVEIYGMTGSSIEMVRENVENLIKEHCKSKTIDNNGGGCLSPNQMHQVADLVEKLQLRVEIQKDNIVINGQTDEVLDFIVKFNSMVQSAKEQESRRQEEAQINAFVQWEFVHNGKFQQCEQSINCDLEKFFQDKKETARFRHNGETLTVNFKKMQVEDLKGNVTIIKRLLEGGTFELPATWSDMSNREFVKEVVPKGTLEYNEVAEKFKMSCENYVVKIIKIERIQNLKLWQSYSIRKKTVERKIPGANVEQILYHGTTKGILHKVNKTGFNRSFCGRNATSYGKGTYFALKASYSCNNTYSTPDRSKCKYIYQARVITGNKCFGTERMLEPAPVNAHGDPTDLCDCAVNDLINPAIFVIFCDDGAYPEYLITFATRE